MASSVGSTELVGRHAEADSAIVWQPEHPQCLVETATGRPSATCSRPAPVWTLGQQPARQPRPEGAVSFRAGKPSPVQGLSPRGPSHQRFDDPERRASNTCQALIAGADASGCRPRS